MLEVDLAEHVNLAFLRVWLLAVGCGKRSGARDRGRTFYDLRVRYIVV